MLEPFVRSREVIYVKSDPTTSINLDKLILTPEK